MDTWVLTMFGSAWLGSLVGLLWPILVAMWKREFDWIYKWIGLDTKLGAAAPAPSGLWGFWVEKVFPFLRFLLLALIISAVAAALGFGAFLQDEKIRNNLKELGLLGYFSAFSFGFTAAGLVGEGMRVKKD
jgi:hypothetical protein